MDNGFINAGLPSGDPQILSYDPSTFNLAGVLPFSLNNPPEDNELLRWGTDGFAFRNNDSYPSDAFTNPESTSQIILVRTSLATPSAGGLVTVTSLSPNSAAAGSPALMLTVNGSGFATDATVLWNGLTLPTIFVSGTQLTATIPATDVAMSGTAQVSVSSGGTVSTGLSFAIGGAAALLSTKTITFPAQTVAMSSPAQIVTIQNTGGSPLTGLSISTTGTDVASFSANSTCGNALAPGSSCAISVVFTPTAAGSRQANLMITDNAPDSPQTITLSGTAVVPDFVLSPPTGASTATLSAGQSANFNFSIGTVGAFTDVVTMSCTNLPMYATCTFTPASFTVGSTPTTVSLSLNTQQTVTASLRRRPKAPGWPDYLPEVAVLFALPVISRRTRQRLSRAKSVLWLVAIFAGALWLNGCGGNPNPPAQTLQKTPAGNYIIMVVATSGALSHNDQITLVVQ